ncbi:MAG: AIR carboxylase family protein [Candidatus Bathyarchaeia archaeon]
MGSKSDLSFARQIGEFLAKEGFSIKCEYSVASAHKTPELLLSKMKVYEESDDNIVYVTIAGLSDALSGVVAGFTKHPVIACPPDLDKHGWKKAFSSIMTPKGISVLLAPNPENAALSAVKILALTNVSLRKEVSKYMQKKKDEVIQADREVAAEKT